MAYNTLVINNFNPFKIFRIIYCTYVLKIINFIFKEIKNIEAALKKIEKESEIELSEKQKEAIEEINKIIAEATNVDSEKGIATANYGEVIIMYLLRELSSIGAEIDEYTYEALITKFDINNLLQAVTELIEDLTNEMIENQIKEIKMINSMLRIMEMNLSAEETQQRFNKLLKKQGVNLTVEEIVQYKNNPEKIAELINQSKIKNNKKRKK